jgi:uncharacterized protein with GYD domain
MAKKLGVTVDVYWTLGQYDIVLILEAQDDMVAAELGLSLGRLGNVRTQTMRAFGPAEVTKASTRWSNRAAGLKEARSAIAQPVA